jgi:hypothetical protein
MSFTIFLLLKSGKIFRKFPVLFFSLFSLSSLSQTLSQNKELDQYNIAWTTQSKNSSESMPCGGGDIGLNVWVENGDVLLYISRAGSFDENNLMLKAGRIRIKLSPDPFNKNFRQELDLKNGFVKISGGEKANATEIKIWVDAFNPVVHADIHSGSPVNAEITYENWRHHDRINKTRENYAGSYKWIKDTITTYHDNITFNGHQVLFYHRNLHPNIFDYTVHQQQMDSVKSQMFDPLTGLTSGGIVEAKNFIAAGNTDGKYAGTDFKGWKLKSRTAAKDHQVNIYLHTSQSSFNDWTNGLNDLISGSKNNASSAFNKTVSWWNAFWEKSFVFIEQRPDLKNYAPGVPSENIKIRDQQSTPAWQAGRNYMLYHYMQGCIRYGNYPTKFNGGLFTFDPVFNDTGFHFTPDFRMWGGGTHTAQNQRLVYWPMLRSGDFELLKPQLNFYMQMLRNAELRSRVYWDHAGACFTEQIENFGLPNPAEYGYKRPDGFDKGVEYNAWLEYEWDTVLEFCYMILELEKYSGEDIKKFLPLVESCLTFFDEHYKYLAGKRGIKSLDGNGHLVLYPGSGAETYKMANNSTSTIAALSTVLSSLLHLPSNYLTKEKRDMWAGMLKRIPPLNYTTLNGRTMISPARSWERINNVESTQLYPVFPWGIYGVGKPGLDTAINTYRYDTNAVKFRSHVGWKQDNIWAARLGLTDEAKRLTEMKMKNSGRRFPAFWGPGFDYTPDHNWGGSGMIGLQEMLLQTDDKKIFLFPAWPKDWDVHFKLHAPYQTTVEAIVKNGKVEMIKVIPESRRLDVVNMW